MCVLHSCQSLKPRIDGLALQRQDTEDTFVREPQWFLAHKALQRFDSQGKFPACN